MPYVESPLDRIVNVHFGATFPLTTLAIGFSAEMNPLPGIPLYPLDDQHVMTVSTVNLPVFERTTVRAPPADNVAGVFPDGPPSDPTSLYSLGEYGIGQPEFRGPVSGGANYVSNSQTPFNGASLIAITITCTLRAILNASGYNVSAAATGRVKDGAELRQDRPRDTAAGGGTITYTATLDIASSALTLERSA